MTRLIRLLLPIALIAACTPSQKTAQPEKHLVTDRFASLTGYEERSDRDALVKIATEVASIPEAPPPPGAKKTLFDLSPKGQAEMEELTGKKDKKIDSALEALANKTFQNQKDDDETTVDLSSHQRQITFDISEEMSQLVSKTLSPADRIESMALSLSLDDNTANAEKFVGWSQLTTKYGQYNIGGISFGRSNTSTLNPSVTIGAVTASIGSLSKTDSFTQGDSLIQQFVSLSGHLTEKGFVLEMNSVPSTTLLGRTSLTVSLKSRQVLPKYIFSFGNLFDDKALANKPGKIKVKSTTYLIPQLTADELGATLTCNYLMRHVEHGAETYFEGDDVIKYYYGHFTQAISGLIVKEDVLPKAWIIRRGTDQNAKNDPSVTIENIVTGETPELTFVHYPDAIRFLHWLQNPAQPPIPPDGIRIGGYLVHLPAHGNFSLDVVPL